MWQQHCGLLLTSTAIQHPYSNVLCESYNMAQASSTESTELFHSTSQAIICIHEFKIIWVNALLHFNFLTWQFYVWRPRVALTDLIATGTSFEEGTFSFFISFCVGVRVCVCVLIRWLAQKHKHVDSKPQTIRLIKSVFCHFRQVLLTRHKKQSDNLSGEHQHSVSFEPKHPILHIKPQSH